MGTPDGYARPELLAEPDWLWQHRDDPGLRILDCGDPAGYDRAHIPGAVRLHDTDDGGSGAAPGWLKDPDDAVHVMGPEPFAALMTRRGVSNDTTVVAYDDGNGTAATRLWWVLGYYGHARVRVLNGGWRRWLDDHRPVTFRETEPPPGRFVPRAREAMRVRLDEVRERHADPAVRVVNVLWPEMFAGTDDPFANKRAGHIPGSVNLPIERFFADEEVPVFKPAGVLRAALAEAGVTPDRETIVHCQAGVRSTLALFVTALLGWDNARVYEASLGEWANRDDTPLTTGTG